MARKKQESLEKVLWLTANRLKKNVDAAEYKHVVLGLVFLRYISYAFDNLHSKLKEGKGEYEGADPEDKDEYKGENIFFVPQKARWSFIQDNAKNVEIGKLIDSAMEDIERENSRLKGVLPKVYVKENLDTSSLGILIDMIGNIDLGDATGSNSDVLSYVFKYLLGEFALAEGKKGGQFYTPSSVVELLVQMLEPYKGRIMDPCCGSGGMFVQSEKFVLQNRGKLSDISVYGQESNQTTWRLAKMNLAIRGIDSSQVKWNNEGSFLRDEHKDIKADYIVANPPFNDDDWSDSSLNKDCRWQYGVPPASNANYAWIQHFLHHLSPSGQAGFVLSKSSLTTKASGEDDIRRNLVEAGLVDCIVNLPTKLFLNTQIPACMWFISRDRENNGKFRNRKDEILFIDARYLGNLISRRNRQLSRDDISLISDTYHNWRNIDGNYLDIPGFCKSENIERVKELDCVLMPGCYVGLANNEEKEFDFSERFMSLKTILEMQLKDEDKINKSIITNLSKIDMNT
ncbi:type I restriction-modification system subunit M [Ichthyobacterium seriolicida]|uniref:site-specific DNA-methyltransferase (adenine-specific) n=1 Tax=Ichthyobacterium seriolicida TaxID=242600 RepID=A0A1J1DVZ3_9FLAO|nr:class I SAM-dependent DNA methyltransferase [Ichthyobacterium seriolicida]BAV94026.1 type I restriction-modification system, DNA-methyltransferase subunit M [Ichthyobacterium seriolicida]